MGIKNLFLLEDENECPQYFSIFNCLNGIIFILVIAFKRYLLTNGRREPDVTFEDETDTIHQEVHPILRYQRPDDREKVELKRIDVLVCLVY